MAINSEELQILEKILIGLIIPTSFYIPRAIMTWPFYRIILDELSSNNWNTNIGFEFFWDNDWSGSISYGYERAGSSSHINSYHFNVSWFF